MHDEFCDISWIHQVPGELGRPHPRALASSSARYTMLDELGRGLTGVVHRAIEHRAGGGTRQVALKRLSPRLAEDDGFVTGFVKQAARAAGLCHPNIARTYKLGRGATGYFVSRELVVGHDLASLLELATKRRLRPTPVVILSILWELCDALDHVHHLCDRQARPLRLVHGGLAPRKLLVDGRGHLKLIDVAVGLARPDDSELAASIEERRRTHIGPEVGAGRPVDARAEVHAVGAIARELAGDQMPEEMAPIVDRALASEPGRRWRNAGAMRMGLAALRMRMGVQSGARAVAHWVDALGRPM